MNYFSDRESGVTEQTIESVGENLWGGLFSIIQGKLDDHSLGYGFSEMCSDGDGPCGCDEFKLGLRAKAEIPLLEWPLKPDVVPSTEVVMDLLEFCAKNIGLPIEGMWHNFMRHYHLSWDHDKGLKLFVDEVNLLFQRNGVAYELSMTGKAQRLINKTFIEPFKSFLPFSGDAETDRLIHKAKELFLSPDLEKRRDSLEKLFDAFERLKTLEDGKDKKQQAITILAKAASQQPKFHEVLNDEAKALSKIGNTFQIRHSETDQEKLLQSHDVDYVFIRLFAFIQKVFSATGRINSAVLPPLPNK